MYYTGSSESSCNCTTGCSVISHILKDNGSYCIGYKMLQRHFDVFIKVFDRRAGVGHTGWHHKGVEGLTILAALKIITKCLWITYFANVNLKSVSLLFIKFYRVWKNMVISRMVLNVMMKLHCRINSTLKRTGMP